MMEFIFKAVAVWLATIAFFTVVFFILCLLPQSDEHCAKKDRHK
jgi:hypothetical protein